MMVTAVPATLESSRIMKLPARAILCLMLAFAPIPADAQSSGQSDKVLTVAPDDLEMAAAIEQARASLDEFLTLSEASPPEQPRSN
ncbi:hypothetical protein [Mesorhizobium sp.]|uniref:hypothetical protein n=1 Tax=Mesorhizobium sp. TaxID=1871066 RepID=UPI0025BC9B10|nr:hypothetical protein [Mesorhizobium sp.]